MITTRFDYAELKLTAEMRKTNMVRVLFDTHVYKVIDRRDFEASSRGHNNSMVQISDVGVDFVDVRIKTKGVSEKIGNGK